jgi:hypothetical protein
MLNENKGPKGPLLMVQVLGPKLMEDKCSKCRTAQMLNLWFVRQFRKG